MNTRRVAAFFCLGIFLSAISGFAEPTSNPSVVPANKMNSKWWKNRHQQRVKLAKEGNIDLIFIGDSITHSWERSGKDVWAKYYTPRHALNLGFSADRTEHVIWRLQNGEIDGISPKLAVIMIGTNNTGQRKDPAEQTAEGVKKIIDILRKQLPDTKILLLGVFPRSSKATDKPRVTNREINDIISTYADNKNIYYLNINEKFLDADGVLPRDIMPDLLHPNAKGYQIWAEAIEPMVKKLMGN